MIVLALADAPAVPVKGVLTSPDQWAYIEVAEAEFFPEFAP